MLGVTNLESIYVSAKQSIASVHMFTKINSRELTIIVIYVDLMITRTR